MTQKKTLGDYWDQYKDDPEFIAEGLAVDIVEEIVRILDREDISNKELSERLGTSKAYVTKFLNGNPNMTLLTLSKIAIALKMDLVPPKFIQRDKFKYSSYISEIVKIFEDPIDETNIPSAA